MVRARRFVNVAAYRAVANPAWSRIFRENYYQVSLLPILGHCFDVVSLGKALNPQMLHLTQARRSTRCDRDRPNNVYDKFNAPKWLQDCMLSVELRWHTNEQVQ